MIWNIAKHNVLYEHYKQFKLTGVTFDSPDLWWYVLRVARCHTLYFCHEELPCCWGSGSEKNIIEWFTLIWVCTFVDLCSATTVHIPSQHQGLLLINVSIRLKASFGLTFDKILCKICLANLILLFWGCMFFLEYKRSLSLVIKDKTIWKDERWKA